MKTGEDNGRKYIKMEDSFGGHYCIILKTKKENNKSFSLRKKTQESHMDKTAVHPNRKVL